ncbi:hypothetical protein HMPREF0518_1400 [Lactobacillus helveticus DSM 20075 = CGMCC 1.1877]|nr:hypothetical protein HMPREF0518_1400 [Lactobacillus helveticus DSM 20075 = CGMCC 1.1877]
MGLGVTALIRSLITAHGDVWEINRSYFSIDSNVNHCHGDF